MANMTLSIPEAMHKEMKKYPEIKWSIVARKSFQKQLKLLEEVYLVNKGIEYEMKQIKSGRQKTTSFEDLKKKYSL